MKFLYAILFSIILLYTLLFSLLNLSWLGGGGTALAVLSGFALYKIITYLYLGFIEEERKFNRTNSAGVSKASDALNLLIFSDFGEDNDSAEFCEYVKLEGDYKNGVADLHREQSRIIHIDKKYCSNHNDNASSGNYPSAKGAATPYETTTLFGRVENDTQHRFTRTSDSAKHR